MSLKILNPIFEDKNYLNLYLTAHNYNTFIERYTSNIALIASSDLSHYDFKKNWAARPLYLDAVDQLSVACLAYTGPAHPEMYCTL